MLVRVTLNDVGDGYLRHNVCLRGWYIVGPEAEINAQTQSTSRQTLAIQWCRHSVTPNVQRHCECSCV